MSKEHGQRSVAALIAEANSGRVLLPNFQRSYVWKPDDAESLAASILLGIPCGSLLLISGVSDDFAARKVGLSRSETSPNQNECDFLLDGQQRASTIRALFSDTFGERWTDAWGEMFGALKNRWSVRVVPADDDPDLFGYRNLRFTGLQPEPDLLADALVQKRIFKTRGEDSWFHPAFEPSLGENEKRRKIAMGAAEDGEIPLWGICGVGMGEDGLIKRALQRIADERRDELLEAIKDHSIDRQAFADLIQPGETWESVIAGDNLRDRLTDRRAEWIQGVLKVFLDVNEFRLGTIELTKDELPKAIAIFEAINRGGSPLTPFDLVTARYARGQAANSLPEMIQGRIDKFSEGVPAALSGHEGRTWRASAVVTLADNSLTTAFKSQLLQVLVMLRQIEANADVEFSVEAIKTQKVLSLGASDIDAHWAGATDAILAAWRFLQIRCGVKDEGSLRNKLLILPIALALRTGTVPKATYDKVEYWYWSSVLTKTYTSRQNENSVTDTNLLLRWIRGGQNPFEARGSQVLKDEGYSNRETLLRQVDDERVGTDVGLYLLQLTLALGGQDILLKRRLNADSDELQDHHLIPLGTATSVGQSSRDIRKGKDKLAELLNSPLNRAYQSASTNQAIGAMTIGQYMKDIPDTVKASLYLPADEKEYRQKEDQTYMAHVRGLLAERFDGLRAAVVNHLTGLVS